MTDIVEFIRARLDEDEQIANAACDAGRGDTEGDAGQWFLDADEDADKAGVTCGAPQGSIGRPSPLAWGIVVYDEGYPHKAQAEHIARHDPARVLRQVAALREVVKECETLIHQPALVSEGFIAAEQILASLAAAYGWSAVGNEGGAT